MTAGAHIQLAYVPTVAAAIAAMQEDWCAGTLTRTHLQQFKIFDLVI